MLLLFFKSFVPAHQRTLADGSQVTVRPHFRRGEAAIRPVTPPRRRRSGDQQIPLLFTSHTESTKARQSKPPPRKQQQLAATEQQLALDFKAAPIEWRPKPDKKAALDALKLTYRLGKKGSVLGMGVTFDFLKNGAATLIGKRIKSHIDLAAAAQIYRDPRFETFRYIGVNDAREVVGILGFSSRLPDAATVGPSVDGGGKPLEEEVREQLEQLKGLGATGFWLTHNHPSGVSTPSAADVNVTNLIAKVGDSLDMKTHGHVVVNSGEYSVLRIGQDPGRGRRPVSGRHFTTYALEGDDPILKPSKPHPVLGRTLNGANKVVETVKGLMEPRAGHAVLLALDNKRRVRAVIDAPSELIDDATRQSYPMSQATKARQGYARARVYLRRIARSIGSTAIIAVLPKNDPRLFGLKDLIGNGYLLDALAINSNDTLGGMGMASPNPYADALSKRERRKDTAQVIREGFDHA